MYLLIWWVDGEKQEMICDNRNEIDWAVVTFEVGTRYEVWKRSSDGFDFQYSITKRGEA